jgi:hypothetical protein
MSTAILDKTNVQRALELKRNLMISPYDYRVHYTTPGPVFHSAWMEAEDQRGQRINPGHCAGKTVAVCLFPALLQFPTQKLPHDAGIPAALTRNNRFFNGREEKCPANDFGVIVQAVILWDASD